jgi:hypothetical protein
MRNKVKLTARRTLRKRERFGKTAQLQFWAVPVVLKEKFEPLTCSSVRCNKVHLRFTAYFLDRRSGDVQNCRCSVA